MSAFYFFDIDLRVWIWCHFWLSRFWVFLYSCHWMESGLWSRSKGTKAGVSTLEFSVICCYLACKSTLTSSVAISSWLTDMTCLVSVGSCSRQCLHGRDDDWEFSWRLHLRQAGQENCSDGLHRGVFWRKPHGCIHARLLQLPLLQVRSKIPRLKYCNA